ncbi:hypothetical protein PR202_ga28681 [Eleusine coracana subsp. coracana]|uniref:tetraacyldisaccharide 4'-kinase n=1 Tax=Eleusine coracana subsp. coracana TaxID=191504 RepID=A0AAV5DJG8_ELECO|nr:hypothetical protein PR202_ga28681 [Eleusine coracana subsp. coracana]
MEEKARQLIGRLAATPDAAVPRLPFLHRAFTLPLLSAVSVALRVSQILSSSRLRRRHALPVPVVSVGNITWGGNGKTPMVEFLARAFHRLGVSPLLLTRVGLVPREKGFILVVQGYAGGDEFRMLRRRLSDTSAKIGVGAKRAAVASSMLQKYGYIPHSAACNNLESGKIGVAILDDGMQHWSLLRDVEIVMVNGLAPWENTHFIPRGPMREPLRAFARADIVVIHNADLVSDWNLRLDQTKTIASEEQLGAIRSKIERNGAKCSVFYSRLTPSHIFEANQPSRRLPLNVLKDKMVLCVSAIGCPDAFIHTVREVLYFFGHFSFSFHGINLLFFWPCVLSSACCCNPIYHRRQCAHLPTCYC